jgi:predicted PurR-regulated permease PerM
MVDGVITFLRHRAIKRVIALAAFLAVVILLRHLATLLVFYLVISRGLGALSEQLAKRTPIGERLWAVALLVVLLGSLGALVASGVHRSVPAVMRLGATAQEHVDSFKQSDFYRMLEAHNVDLDQYGEKIRHLGEGLLASVRTTGRTLLHVLLGLVLAVIYLFERKEVTELWARVPRESFLGYLIAFWGFLGEAILLTVKVQVVVALVNAIITLPILIALRLPKIPTLMLMVFAFGLVPVVGNFLSGIVLGILSYLKSGWLGVGIFLVSTFVLHKVESYYLNPRLTSKHVKLPSLMLVTSLIVWEHLLGMPGIFISFPVLYVTLRVRDLFRTVEPPPPSPAPPDETVASAHTV